MRTNRDSSSSSAVTTANETVSPRLNRDPSAATLIYPILASAAGTASRAGRQGHTRLVIADLALLATAAGLGIVTLPLAAVGIGWQRALAAVLLVLALIAKLTSRLRDFDAQWFDGRAVAETVKSAAWRYAMRLPPYATDEKATDDAFRAVLREALAARPNLATHLHPIAPDSQLITPSMRQVRNLSTMDRKQLYLTARVHDQVGWYGTKAAANARSAQHWFWVGLGAQSLALIVAIGLVAAPDRPDLGIIGGLTTVAAVAVAWTQFSRHDELGKSYALAAQELAFLRSDVEGAHTEEEFAKAVAETESAISREHTMWMARRG